MHVRIDMLGGFSVTVDDVAVPDDAWSRRHAAGLVKLLALARGRRMHREQVVDALWPDLSSTPPGPGCTRPPTTRAARSASRPTRWCSATTS